MDLDKAFHGEVAYLTSDFSVYNGGSNTASTASTTSSSNKSVGLSEVNVVSKELTATNK